jgi:hypothetical protein
MRALLPIALLACREAPKDPVDRAVEFLISRQSGDGSWKSEKYQGLSRGHVLTSFVLYALGQVDRTDRFKDRIELGLQFLLKDEGGMEHPNYAAALAISALVRFKPQGWEEAVERRAGRLLAFQLSEATGWIVDDPEYGGWDYGGAPPRRPSAFRPDLSVSAFVCEALAAAGKKGHERAALAFADRCRNEDGGFIFTTQAMQSYQNKAGDRRSYGTPTADAVRLLRACGVPDSDPRIRAALQWLDGPADRVRGFPEGMREPWPEGLFYYWSYVRARIGLHREEIRTRLLALQRPDGGWENPVGIMKEDDPIIATGLALVALVLK